MIMKRLGGPSEMAHVHHGTVAFRKGALGVPDGGTVRRMRAFGFLKQSHRDRRWGKLAEGCWQTTTGAHVDPSVTTRESDEPHVADTEPRRLAFAAAAGMGARCLVLGQDSNFKVPQDYGLAAAGAPQ